MFHKEITMPTIDISKAIGIAGEYWVASTILFQGAEKGYRICTVDVDDFGTDLFIFKYENGAVINTFEIQVKTVRTLQHKDTRAAFSLKRSIHHGLNNYNRIYVLIYAPSNVKYCWVLTENDIIRTYRNITETSPSISFSIKENARERGIRYRCTPENLFTKIENIMQIAHLPTNNQP